MVELSVDRLVAGLGDDAEDSAITISTEWEPIGGVGAPVKPAIYSGGRYQFGERWWDAGAGPQRTTTVSLDGVASQANRLEAALRSLRARLALPELILDLSGIPTLPSHLPKSLSSFEFPHRNADAYLRDSELDGTPFLKSDIGKQIFGASGSEPDGLLRWMPQTFLFGFWQSHLGKKRQQTKWPRTWTSELFGLDPAADETNPRRTLGTKGDPLNLSIDTALHFDDSDTTNWEFAEGKGQKVAGAKSTQALSNLGHGQVPFRESESSPLGVSCRSIHQLSTVSFAGLRRLAAPPEARALLVALGVVAHRAAFGRGVALRSGCELRPSSTRWRWLGGTVDEGLEVPSLEELVDMTRVLAEQAEKAGSPVGSAWAPEPLTLRPNSQLVKVIRESWPLEPVA